MKPASKENLPSLNSKEYLIEPKIKLARFIIHPNGILKENLFTQEEAEREIDPIGKLFLRKN